MKRKQKKIKKDKLFYHLAEDYICDLNKLLSPYFLDEQEIAQLTQDIQHLQDSVREHMQKTGQQAISFKDCENKTVLTITPTPEIKVHKGYRWDGCSPKWNFLDLFWLGIPDGVQLRTSPLPTNFSEYRLAVKTLSSAAYLPSAEQNQMFVAKISDRYHIRIFDYHGDIVINQVSGEFLPDLMLIQDLDDVLDTPSIDPKTECQLREKIASILRHAHVRLVQDVPRKALGASAVHDVLGYCKRDQDMPSLFRAEGKDLWFSPSRRARDQLFFYLLKRRKFAPQCVYYIAVSLLGPIFDILFGFTNKPSAPHKKSHLIQGLGNDSG